MWTLDTLEKRTQASEAHAHTLISQTVGREITAKEWRARAGNGGSLFFGALLDITISGHFRFAWLHSWRTQPRWGTRDGISVTGHPPSMGLKNLAIVPQSGRRKYSMSTRCEFQRVRQVVIGVDTAELLDILDRCTRGVPFATHVQRVAAAPPLSRDIKPEYRAWEDGRVG